MPTHNKHHYVPRCYLKPFSVQQNEKTINLLNIRRRLFVEGASIRYQCYRKRFYGDDLVIEGVLQQIEGRYASIVKGIIEEYRAEHADLQFLRDFCYLQYLRTDIAARRTALAERDMAHLVFEGEPEDRRPNLRGEKEIVQNAIATFFETVAAIGDLKVFLAHNRTKYPFVTSDDPAALINRFYSQRLGPRWKSAGIESAGAMLFLPLSPSFLMCSYDGDVYTCPDIADGIVRIDKESDVVALNILQYLKASQNIYFSDWAGRELVQNGLDAVAERRPDKWHHIHYAVKDDEGSVPGWDRFRVVHTEAERLAAMEALIHVQNVMLVPLVWLSKIKFRHKPKFVYNQTGRGYTRRSERPIHS